MSRHKKAKAELAKIIRFDGWRSKLSDAAESEAETAAQRDWTEAHRLSAVTKETDPKEKIEAFRSVVRRGLESVFEMRLVLDDIARRGAVTPNNAKWANWIDARLEHLTEWDDWCAKHLKRFAPDATIYNLADFRRFKNRVTQKGATP